MLINQWQDLRALKPILSHYATQPVTNQPIDAHPLSPSTTKPRSRPEWRSDFLDLSSRLFLNEILQGLGAGIFSWFSVSLRLVIDRGFELAIPVIHPICHILFLSFFQNVKQSSSNDSLRFSTSTLSSYYQYSLARQTTSLRLWLLKESYVVLLDGRSWASFVASQMMPN